MKTITTGELIEIPKSVAVCPHCGKKLVARCEAWTEIQDGEWTASEAAVDCTGEPDPDDEEAWDDFWAVHSEMPYVYWLPMSMTVLKWIQANFRFDM